MEIEKFAIAILVVISYLAGLRFKIKKNCLELSIRTMTVQRWTDEMLDGLASSVTELRDGFADVRESITEIRDSVDGLRVTSQALLQVAAQSQRDMEAI